MKIAPEPGKIFKINTEALARALRRKYKRLDLCVIIAKRSTLLIALLIVPKLKRNKGIGTKVMTALTNYADQCNVRMSLVPYYPSSDKVRLISFYKRFGFVRNTHSRIGEMVRIPKKGTTNAAA
jgi:GNAT superfamily N-acetyltransferase